MNAKKSPLLIIFLVIFIDLVGFGIVIPILPYYATRYGASPAELGWLMMCYSAAQFFFAPLWGRLSDHIGRRPVLLFSMFGTSLSMVILGIAPDLLWLFFGRIFGGISGANISTATAYISDVTTPENRAKGMGMIGAAFGLGFIFGPAIGGVLSRYGYSAPMFFAAGLSFVNIIFAYYRLTEPASTKAVREKNRVKRFDKQAFIETMGDSRTRMATLLFFLATLAITQLEVCFALFMTDRYKYDAQAAGWLLAFMGTMMVVIQGGFIGKLSKKFGEGYLILLGTLFMAIGLIFFALSQHAAIVIFALSLLAVGNGITNPSLSSLASKGARAERRGATLGVYQSAGSLARVLGPPIAGWMYGALGMAVPFLSAAFLMFTAGFLTVLRWSALCATEDGFRKGLLRFRFFRWVKEATQIFRTRGLKALVKTYGWKMVAGFIAYYLVRDVTLYILLPWMAAQGILSLK
ncbi:MAG: MFS transporter [Bdellovibrionota bacterium]